MNAPKSHLDISVIDTLHQLDRIEHEYTDLLARSRNPSIYVSFEFVRTAWVHFSAASDRLFLLTIRSAGRLIAIAPFVIEPEPLFFFPSYRVIKYITEWGYGDKPRILTSEDEDLVWDEICNFLSHTFCTWDAIALDEQIIDSAARRGRCFSRAGYHIRLSRVAASQSVSLAGEWSNYLQSRKTKVRSEWARCKRRLSEHGGPLSVDCIVAPGEILSALDRYIALEQTAWKGRAHFSIGGNPGLTAFYRELVERFAAHRMVAFYFLRSAYSDVAAAIIFRVRDRAYGAHICHNPELSKFSPGIILNAEILETHFSTQFRLFDFLALQSSEKSNRFKENWATDTEALIHIAVSKGGARHLLHVSRRKLITVRAAITKWCRRNRDKGCTCIDEGSSSRGNFVPTEGPS